MFINASQEVVWPASREVNEFLFPFTLSNQQITHHKGELPKGGKHCVLVVMKVLYFLCLLS